MKLFTSSTIILILFFVCHRGSVLANDAPASTSESDTKTATTILELTVDSNAEKRETDNGDATADDAAMAEIIEMQQDDAELSEEQIREEDARKLEAVKLEEAYNKTKAGIEKANRDEAEKQKVDEVVNFTLTQTLTAFTTNQTIVLIAVYAQDDWVRRQRPGEHARPGANLKTATTGAEEKVASENMKSRSRDRIPSDSGKRGGGAYFGSNNQVPRLRLFLTSNTKIQTLALTNKKLNFALSLNLAARRGEERSYEKGG